MKILHVMPYCPIPPIFGGALRMYHLLNNLPQKHEVTVVAYGSEQDRQRMTKEFGHRVKAIHIVPHVWLARFRRLGQLYALLRGKSFYRSQTDRREMQEMIDRILSEDDFDIVQTEFPMMASFRYSTRALKVMDAHNVEYDCYRRLWEHARSFIRRAHYFREYQVLFREEIAACRKQDALFVTSQRDKELFDIHVPYLPKFIIPNGVDCAYFAPSHETPEPHSLVFTGMMGYIPNDYGMQFFLDEMFPHILREVPDAKVYIVGSRPSRELLRRRSANVIVTGFVPDVRPYVNRASVYVVPLTMGGGTRLKVLEAMAMKKPIVTTSVGCEGIDVQDGETAFIEDDPREFAQRVVELLRSPRVRQRFSDAGFELVRSRYEWSVIGKSVNEIYEQQTHVSGRKNVELPVLNNSVEIG